MNRIQPNSQVDAVPNAEDNGRAQPQTKPAVDVTDAVDKLHEQVQELRQQLGGVIVGMDEVSEQLMIALLCKGHCMLQGMPGLAKTMLVSTIASLLDLSFAISA